MGMYKYTAKGPEGKVSGTINASTKADAMAQLRTQYPTILSLSETNAQFQFLNGINIGSQKVKTEKIVLMCAQFSNMLKCGLQTANSVELVAKGTEDKQLKKILSDVYQEVKGGRSIADSFELVAPKAFPNTFFETLRAGEDSGNVDEAFDTLYHYFDKQGQTSKKIKSAMIYPIFMIIVAIAVVIVILIAVIPQLSSSFEEFGSSLPIYTKILIDASDLVLHRWYIILLVVAAFFISYKVAYSRPKGRYYIDLFKLKIPVLGKINNLEASGQFATTLAMLLRSGVPTVQALKIVAKIFTNEVYKVNTFAMAEDVKSGMAVGTSMEKKGIFLPTLVSMVDNGDKTGNMEAMLSSIGEYYNSETDLAVKNAMAKLEPTMLVVIAAFAGYIVISIYLPIFQLYGLM